MSKLSKLIKTPHLFFLDAILNRAGNTKNDTRTRKVNLSDGVNTFVFGFSPWKGYIERWFPQRKLCFLPKDIKQYELEEILPYILKAEDPQIFIWGFKVNPVVLDFARKHNVTCVFVEDGFIRSVSLGATKALPLSLTFDTKTPYFNSREESDLEVLLNTYDFQSQPDLISRSRIMIDSLIHSGISKYNHAKNVDIEEVYGIKTKKRILVVGQVEDDASIIYGCDRDMTNNDLVRIAVLENKDAQIIYKPHPDVLNKHRKKLSNPDDVRPLCLILELDIPLSQAFETVDHVYTMTSLAGFEALIRGIKVTTLGCPFYSGWGLTDDRQPNPRRQRCLSVEEVFAAAYILYPRYFDPAYNRPLTPEQAIRRLQDMLGQAAKTSASSSRCQPTDNETMLSCLLQSNFAGALALSDFGQGSLQPWMVYAAYRLGLCQTVLDAQVPITSFEVLLAKAVSCASAGQIDSARSLLDHPMISQLSSEQRSELSSSLAPYLPELAFQLIETADSPLSLKAALLQKFGRHDEANSLLVHSLTSGNSNPNLFLLAANTLSSSAVDKVVAVNRFLKSFSLAPVSLDRTDQQLSAANLKIDSALKPMDGPLVSVLMTAYNSSERIVSAMDSVLNQTYWNLELIVVDDASSDNTGALVEAIAEVDPRVRYFRLPVNVGTYVAKNIGLQYATGEFTTCHDSDDWCHPVKIERQVAPLLEDKRLVFTTSHWVRMQDDGIFYARPVHPLMRINPASPLFRRQLVIEKAGGWDPVRTGADSEFLARLKLVFGRMAMKRITQPLTLGSHRSDSLMTAKDTGYSAEGMSPIRLAYWETWNHWHIDELRARRKPRLQSLEKGRCQFDAPESILVPQVDIAYCLKDVEYNG